jgi:Sulfotransferase family
MSSSFRGPIFIIGMPRSGTKLIRALLNQHPQINLTLAESHFIPYFVRKFGNPPPFQVRDDLNAFMRELQQTSFLATMRKAGYTLDEGTFLQNIDYTTWSGIFEPVLRHFGSKRETRDTIWGDKTPGYINHMPLLKALFPDAKFLHIIRDPRDYCLSVRKSFRKSIYRAAFRWRLSVENARKYGVRLGDDYMEVRYESLLETPVSVMTQVASFLKVPYDDALVSLASPSEQVGDAKGQIQIVKDNKSKYLTHFSRQEVKRIEEIVCDVAKSAGYHLMNDVVQDNMNPFTLGVLKLYDGVASLRYHIAVEGEFTAGAKRLFHHYTKSSWRAINN